MPAVAHGPAVPVHRSVTDIPHHRPPASNFSELAVLSCLKVHCRIASSVYTHLTRHLVIYTACVMPPVDSIRRESHAATQDVFQPVKYTSVEHDFFPTCYERPPVLSDHFCWAEGVVAQDRFYCITISVLHVIDLVQFAAFQCTTPSYAEFLMHATICFAVPDLRRQHRESCDPRLE